jgi:hypothetical protein
MPLVSQCTVVLGLPQARVAGVTSISVDSRIGAEPSASVKRELRPRR